MKKLLITLIIIAIATAGYAATKLPDVPGNLQPKALYLFCSKVKKTIDVWTGSTNNRVITYQDLIDLGVIDSDGNFNQVNPYEYGI